MTDLLVCSPFSRKAYWPPNTDHLSHRQRLRVCIIGSGTMGRGIAAHLANGGADVWLMDQWKEGKDPDQLAKSALEQMTRSSLWMSSEAKNRVRPGNLRAHRALLKEMDWIIEAIVENLEAKRALYANIEEGFSEFTKADWPLISSNTSTLPLSDLTQGRSALFCEHFFISHFFNPVRQMRLLEVIVGPQTCLETLSPFFHFMDHQLGKELILAYDTPGFIANRLGFFWIQRALMAAWALNLTPFECDTLLKSFGIPKTGVFGLIDLIGLDVVYEMGKNLVHCLPPEDSLQHVPLSLQDHPDFQNFIPPFGPLTSCFESFIAHGYTGQKGKGGFYRQLPEEGVHLSSAPPRKGPPGFQIHPKTGKIQPLSPPSFAHRVKEGIIHWEILKENSPYDRYACLVMSEVFLYAFSLIGRAAPDALSIDMAMTEGYRWAQGPFALLEALGQDRWRQALNHHQIHVPLSLDLNVDLQNKLSQPNSPASSFSRTASSYFPSPPLALASLKKTTSPMWQNAHTALWDLGENISCLELTHPKKIITRQTLEGLDHGLEWGEREKISGLVLYAEGPHFSLGADLKEMENARLNHNWRAIEAFLRQGQWICQAIQCAPFPVIAAPCGLTLGGGCEIVLAADGIEAFCETSMGLVEGKLGLVPGWGGAGMWLARWFPSWQGSWEELIVKLRHLLLHAEVFSSAAYAQEMGLLRPEDGIVMNRARRLESAKNRALHMAQAGYRPSTVLPLTKEPFRCVRPKTEEERSFCSWFAQDPLSDPSLSLDALLEQALAFLLPLSMDTQGNPRDLQNGRDLFSQEKMGERAHQAFLRLLRHPETLLRIQKVFSEGSQK